MKVNIKDAKGANQELDLRRVNVFLGANGMGKSQLLNQLKRQKWDSFDVISIEGGRTIQIPHSLQVNRQIGAPDTIASLEERRKEHSLESLSQRLLTTFNLLDKLGDQLKFDHSDKIHAWVEKGSHGIAPNREEPPLDKLFRLFSEIFPKIKLAFDHKTKHITCSKDGSGAYAPALLSDGEKQILSILADVLILAKPKMLVIIDEPELNLNSLLARRFWELVESNLPDSVFLYATHDVSFSIRSGIDKVFILSVSGINEIKNLSEISYPDLKDLLGSISAILSTDKVLVTEGDANSFDPIFYRWLLGSATVEIMPFGGGSDVAALANRQGVWNQIAPSVLLKGVIDRDFKSNETIARLSTINTFSLEFHEAESYLCDPSLIRIVSEKMGLVANIPSIDKIKSEIFKSFEEQMLGISARRFFAKATLNLSVSLRGGELKYIKDEKVLEEKIIKEAEIQLKKTEKEFSETKMKSLLREELQLCNEALAKKDLILVLRLIPGKELLNHLIQLTGAKNTYDFARACSKHIYVDEFPHLMELRRLLKTQFKIN